MLKKAAIFTDIHFGKKNNSSIHNQDCLDFIDWFCENVKADKSIDHILFLGDWHENRSTINISTLNASYSGAKKINDLGLPVYFIIGNHDLYHRHHREVHSLSHFNEFNNFTLINEPTVIEASVNPFLMAPYLFHDEYPDLANYATVKVWFGHFEFKGFTMAGVNTKMPTGPDPKDFSSPDCIFSGHFHKRQQINNIVYVGNTFPMDYGDAGDYSRGMTIFNHNTQEHSFIDWDLCPKYTYVNLSELLEDSSSLQQNSYVKCTIDIPISFEESNVIRQSFMTKYKLREFFMSESSDLNEALSETDSTLDDECINVDDLVIKMIEDIDMDQIDTNMLINIYRDLEVGYDLF